MSLLTTTIGANPKPDYVTLPDWFKDTDGPDSANPTRNWAKALAHLGAEASESIVRGVQEAVTDQSIASS